MKHKIVIIFIALIANAVFGNDNIVFSKYGARDDTGVGSIASILKMNSNDPVTKLFDESETGLSFEKPYYTATYTTDSKTHSIKADDDIILNGYSDGDVTVSLAGREESSLFNIDCTMAKCTLSIERELNDEILKSTSEIILELQATNEETDESAFALIVINLPLKNSIPAPQFTKSYYIYEYQVDDKGTPSLNPEEDSLALADENDKPVEVKLSDYQENFVITCDTSTKSCEIDIEKPLDEDILKGKTELLISLSGVVENAAGDGTATLLIRFPDEDSTAVSFGKPYYKATYKVAEDKVAEDKVKLDAVEVEEEITINSDSDPKVRLTGDEAFHFNIDCLSGKCKLTVKENFPKSILTEKTEIAVTLEAYTEDDDVVLGSVLIIITLQSKNINSAPQFTQTYYIYKYQIDDGKPSLTPNEDPIDVTSDDKAAVTITLSDYADNFAVTYDPDADQWNVAVTKKLKDNVLSENTELIIGLTDVLEDSDEGVAMLLIELPRKAAANVSFDKTFYEATYTAIKDESDSIAVDENIKITDKEADVTITGVYAHHFAVNCSTDGICLLTVTDDLSEKVLTKEKEIIIALEASTDETAESSTALVIVHLPLDNVKSAPKFSQAYYTYEYQIDGEDASLSAVENSLAITSDDNADVQITLSDYQDNIKVSYDPTTEQWNVDVKEPLDKTVLKENTELVVSLTGQLEDSEQGTATLLIKLPEKSSADVTFKKAFYKATYTVKASDMHDVKTEEDIEFSDSEATVDLTGETAAHFKIDCSTGTCLLTVVDNLSEYALSNNKEVILGLQVTKDDITEPVTSFIIITLPSGNVKPGPQFSHTYYIYEYKTDGKETSLNAAGDSIALTSDSASATVTLSDYQENFEVTYDPAAEQWKIDVHEPLDNSVLESNTELVISLAGELDDSEKSTATLLIKLPEKSSEDVTFDKNLYRARYTVVSGEPHAIEDQEEIAITDSDATVTATVTVTLTGEYASHFNVEYDDKWKLTIKDELSESILSSNTEILLELAVTKDGVIEPVTSFILISLPSGNIKLGPKFSQSYYIYEYIQVDGEKPSLSAVGDPLTVTSDDNESVDVMLIDYPDNFAVKYDSTADQWKIDIAEPLDESVLNENTELVISLTGQLDDSEKSTATLLIKLPEKSSASATFNQTFYKATYTAKAGERHVIKTEEEITISDSEATVALTGDYATHFSIDCSTGTCELTVTDNLSDYILSNTKEIILGLEITESAKSFVLITLPSGNIKLGPKFSQPYYIYEYQIDGEDASLNADGDTISFTSGNSESVQVTLDVYEDNFDVTYHPDADQWSIDVKTPLDKTVLKENTQLVVSLTGELDDSEKSTATLLIILPEKSSGDLTFDKVLYKATYTVNDGESDVVTTDEEIVISDSEATVTITGDYASNFAIDCANYDKCQLSVTEDLPESILANSSEIIIELEVTKPDVIEPGAAIVIISLPLKNMKPAPKFTQTFYTADYKTDESPSITLTGDEIAVISDYEESVIVKLTDYEDTFQPIYDIDAKQWNIVIQEPLNDSILEENTELVIQLTAILENSVDQGTAILLVNLPSKESGSVAFDHAYYTFNYTSNDDTFEVIGDNITISDTSAKVAVAGDFSPFFAIECGANGVCQLQVIEYLSHEILSSNTEIVVTLEASKNDTSEKATALVIINLTVEDSNKILEFSQMIYSAVYTMEDNANDSVTISQPIKIKNVEDLSQITITIEGDNKDSFQPILEDDHWEISVIDNLLPAVINDEISITLTLKAKLKDVAGEGVSAVVVQLPKKTASIRFTSNVYMADYINDANDTIKIENDIIIKGDTAGEATVKVTGAYKEYFSSNYSDSKVTVTLSKTLSSKTLKNATAVSVDIEAIKGTEKIAATLVVKLPKYTYRIWDDNRVLIISLAVLAVLLLVVLIVTVVLCRNKSRKR